jgi:hypothetical protein
VTASIRHTYVPERGRVTTEMSVFQDSTRIPGQGPRVVLKDMLCTTRPKLPSPSSVIF